MHFWVIAELVLLSLNCELSGTAAPHDSTFTDPSPAFSPSTTGRARTNEALDDDTTCSTSTTKIGWSQQKNLSDIDFAESRKNGS